MYYFIDREIKAEHCNGLTVCRSQMGSIVLVHWITNMHQNQIYDSNF